LTRTRTFFLVLAALLVAARLCHTGILWEGDSYPLAAAGQMLHGKALYRGIWFDKPPIEALFSLLPDARAGWPLRLADALYAWLACCVCYAFARDLWSRREGLWAAALAGFFLIFDFPAAVIPAASDMLMLAPHVAAVWLAWKRRPFWSGVLVGVAFWISPKALFVAAACALWNPAGIPWMASGFAAVGGAGALGLWSFGALGAYWEQVWVWGRLYAASSPEASPLANALARTAGWVGFHAALAIAALFFLWRERGKERWVWIGWAAISFAGVAAGMRFFPRYYLELLPVIVLMAARGFTGLGRQRAPVALVALLLLIPLVRFAPTYVEALTRADWRDTAMDRDSRAVAVLVRRIARPSDTLFVWGYRPEIYVYTRLPAATRYLDSQPLTGVPADRHLTESTPVETVMSQARREELAHTQPAFIVDGLGPYNPRLALTSFADLRPWLAGYREVGRTGGSVIYRAASLSGPAGRPLP
jgi:hypothetical protein